MAEPPDQMPAAAGSGGLRGSHRDREQVIGTLRGAFVHGMLAKEEFDLRVGQTFAARTYAQLAVITADLPAGLTIAKPPQAARVQGEPRMPRAGRVLAVATAVCAAMWLAAFSLPVSGPDHDPHAGVALAGTATFFYAILLLMAGTPILADWLNKHWWTGPPACHQATRAGSSRRAITVIGTPPKRANWPVHGRAKASRARAARSTAGPKRHHEHGQPERSWP